MIDITNCNKIIIDTNEKVEKIIDWYEQNKDWLDAEEFRIPIPSALVELPEEDIKFYYEQEGVFVKLHLYMGGVYVCNYRYDPKTQEIENIVFPAGLSKEKRKVARMVLAADRTPYKEALKFHSLMCFATHYRNCIETTEQKEKRISHKHQKRLRRSGGVTPLITTYHIDSRPIPADGTKRHYTKPTEQVSVRGFTELPKPVNVYGFAHSQNTTEILEIIKHTKYRRITMSNLKVYAKTIEDEALEQINTLLSQDAFKDCKVRIMPDVHAGKGCVIGFTADLGDKVIPNIVGVDIGCGMLCVSLGHGDFNAVTLNTLDRVIRTYVPSGKNVHDGRQMRFEELKELYCYRELKDTKRLERSIGTLGGGNHFIEVDTTDDGYKYLVIHTGSRNLGKQVADYYQNLAYELMCGKDDLYDRQEKLIADYKAAGRKSEIESAIKELRRNFRAVTPKLPKDLCYLEGKYREQYLHDMRICQKFAYMNRVMIAQIICNHMGWGVDADMPDFFECIHNYIDHDSNIVRKGAISAKYGEKVLIPINMRDGCILGTGKGNEDWNCSAPHGAGRIMSRMKARETLNMSDYSNSMDGIYTTSVSEETIDEAPMAYKPIDEIVECIGETVDILAILKPIYNFKASE